MELTFEKLCQLLYRWAQRLEGTMGQVEVCCSVSQGVAAWYSVLQSVCRVVQNGAVWCSVVQCGAVWCNVLQCVAVCCGVLQCVVVCCSVLQCRTEWCSELQCVEVSQKSAYVGQKQGIHANLLVWGS